ncbi:unnamed protein product [Ceutorhynchus assimilis]|uniref:Uncharacterized protein n=1 Tax=Ceutorhynchus assimilis TaxID=467358 RepID=A0A9N9MTK2_9CUCU|nr:unnamed protein product [Ceutorhynchus assimilis]
MFAAMLHLIFLVWTCLRTRCRCFGFALLYFHYFQSNSVAILISIEMEWTEDSVLEFIEIYRGKEILWNNKHPRYFNKIQKNDAWEDVARSVGATIDECKKKISALQSALRREKSKIKKSMGTGTELFIWLQIDKETDESNDVDDDTALQDMNPDSEEPQKTNDIQEPDETEEHHEIQKPHGTQQSHETHELRVTQEPNESQQTPKTRIRVSNKERKPPQMTHSIPNKKRAVEKLDAAFEILTKASNKEPPQDPSECQIFGNLVAKKLSKYSNVAQTAVQEAIMNILFAADKGGLWNVPFINNAYLINSTLLKQYSKAQLTHNLPNIDSDMAFCRNLRELNVFMYVSNRVDFGHLINADTYDVTRTEPDMYQIFENEQDWEEAYIRPDYPETFNPDKKPLQPCPDVYWLPIVTKKFCKSLISMMESFGKWSSGRNEDERLQGGYEAVPTRDIHMNQVGWERHWLHFLQKYVRPLQEYIFTGYFHDPPNSLMNFVVRYRPDEQPSLRPHHDSSTYTINIALNEAGKDYQGGGCRFIRYNCSVTDTQMGWMLMHPGRLTHYHEGLRVTNGTRYIMISFVDP